MAEPRRRGNYGCMRVALTESELRQLSRPRQSTYTPNFHLPRLSAPKSSFVGSGLHVRQVSPLNSAFIVSSSLGNDTAGTYSESPRRIATKKCRITAVSNAGSCAIISRVYLQSARYYTDVAQHSSEFFDFLVVFLRILKGVMNREMLKESFLVFLAYSGVTEVEWKRRLRILQALVHMAHEIVGLSASRFRVFVVQARMENQSFRATEKRVKLQ
ncbi:hypothetical protein BJ165DRAFT_1596385 [Panaeolus papilionaceus]|nr:hypothetical protein BJ165DRAFT_1596385 [Panaeolus papilionaceus]